MVAPAVPIAIGAVAVSGIALRLRAIAKKKAAAKITPAAAAPAAAAVTAPPSPVGVAVIPGLVVSPASAAVAQKLAADNPQALVNPDPLGDPNGVMLGFFQAATEFRKNGIPDDMIRTSLAQAGATPAQVDQTMAALNKGSSGDSVAVVGQKAIVTTNDPAPSGDLIVRSAPSTGAPQIGGAEKDGTVTVLDSSDPVFAQISWPGGARWKACTGFAKKQFLKLI